VNYKVCHNAMEVLVNEEIDRQIAVSSEFDLRDFDRCDAVAYALNRLPALYATTEEGWTRQVDRARRGLMDLVEMAVDWGMREAHRKRKPFDTPLTAESLRNPADRALQDLRDLLGRDDISWENIGSAVHDALRERGETIDDRADRNDGVTATPEPQVSHINGIPSSGIPTTAPPIVTANRESHAA